MIFHARSTIGGDAMYSDFKRKQEGMPTYSDFQRKLDVLIRESLSKLTPDADFDALWDLACSLPIERSYVIIEHPNVDLGILAKLMERLGFLQMSLASLTLQVNERSSEINPHTYDMRDPVVYDLDDVTDL
jgi:hypothetical protein